MLKYTLVDVITVSQLVDTHILQMVKGTSDYKDHIKRELEIRAGREILAFMKTHHLVTTSYRYVEEVRPHMYAHEFRIEISIFKVEQVEDEEA